MYLKGNVTEIRSQLNAVVLKGDIGANFADVETLMPVFDKEPVFAIVENTNDTGAGVRLYVKANGVLKYVALS